jgi:hypothetical protein
MRLRGVATFVAVLVTGLLTPWTGLGSPPPKGDMAFGTGTDPNAARPIVDAPTTAHVNARSGPAGEDPTGRAWFRVTSPDFEQSGDVKCLNVIGHNAIVGFRDDETGMGWYIAVDDRDQVNRDEPDTLAIVEAVQPEICPPPGEPQRVITRGNFIVSDG